MAKCINGKSRPQYLLCLDEVAVQWLLDEFRFNVQEDNVLTMLTIPITKKNVECTTLGCCSVLEQYGYKLLLPLDCNTILDLPSKFNCESENNIFTPSSSEYNPLKVN